MSQPPEGRGISKPAAQLSPKFDDVAKAPKQSAPTPPQAPVRSAITPLSASKMAFPAKSR